MCLYKMAWFLHFKHVAPRIAEKTDRLMVVAASLGTKKKKSAFHRAVDDVVWQVSPCHSYRVAFWSMESDPCLQVADYCTWAIQRRERNDTRSYDLISDKIKSKKTSGASAPSTTTERPPEQLAVVGRPQGVFRRSGAVQQ